MQFALLEQSHNHYLRTFSYRRSVQKHIVPYRTRQLHSTYLSSVKCKPDGPVADWSYVRLPSLGMDRYSSWQGTVVLASVKLITRAEPRKVVNELIRERATQMGVQLEVQLLALVAALQAPPSALP